MKLFIWGTNYIADAIIGRHVFANDVTGFISNNKSRTEYMGKKCYRPEEIASMEYDAIIVTVITYQSAVDIQKQGIVVGIDPKKLIFLYSNCAVVDLNRDYAFVERILGKNYANRIKDRHHLVSEHIVMREEELSDSFFLHNYPEIQEEKTPYSCDYVRIKSFELAVREIKRRSVQGNVAEVGVHTGNFAQYINRAFSDRTLYLFDTFEGFDTQETLKEVENNNCNKYFAERYKQNFKSFNINDMLRKMRFLNQIVVKKGFFPESLDGLEDCFAFVSIDVDFEDSIYECIRYFYPRLNQGGYLFIHDYNNYLHGVEAAIDRYERDNHIMLARVPLCDNGGTLIVTK